MRLPVVRAARDQIPECADGLVVTSRLPEDNAEREARFRQVRIECDGLSQRRFGAGEIILLFERHTQVVMNLCGRRLEFRCIPQRSGGLIEPARLHQRRAEIQAGCQVRGLLFHQLTERCDRQIRLSFLHQCQAETVSSVRRRRIDLHGRFERVDGAVRIAGFLKRDAQLQSRRGQLWTCANSLAKLLDRRRRFTLLFQ